MTEQLEKRVFGVCTYLANKMGLKSGVVRMYFIYASFVTFGSPVIFYLAVAFWMNIKKYYRYERNPVWY